MIDPHYPAFNSEQHRRNNWMRVIHPVIACLAVLVTAGQVQAGIITAVDSGWYNDDGAHSATNTNYLAAGTAGNPRNFFVFDLSSATQPIASAKLRLYTFTVSGTLDKTYKLFDVETDLNELVAGTDGSPSASGEAIYNDLGSGDEYGVSGLLTRNMDNQFIEIELKSAALADLNDERGGLFAVGGRMTSGSGGIFASSSLGVVDGEWSVQLITEESPVVPEPSSIALFGLGSLGLGAIGRRRKKRQTDLAG